MAIECNAYGCAHIAKTGNGCTAKQVIVKGRRCLTFAFEQKGDLIQNPRCHREGGKYKADHHSIVK